MISFSLPLSRDYERYPEALSRIRRRPVFARERARAVVEVEKEIA